MDIIAFARGVPAPEMLPVDQLRECTALAFDHDPIGVLSYGTGAGWGPLRAEIARRYDVSDSQVVITTGSLQGFALLAQALATQAEREGRRARVIVEQPSYDRPLLVLRRLGIDVVAVPLDEHGVDVEQLEQEMARGADLVYLIPTFQNPAGCTLSAERRRAVVAAAGTHDVLVLEDDPYGRLYFDEEPPPTLFEQRGSAPIAFSGSFSKTIAPGLRVGWTILPPELAATVSTLANDTYISASLLAQATVHEFIRGGHFDASLPRTRAQLQDRCQRIERALQQHLPGATWVSPAGGYFIWVQLPDELDARAVAQQAPGHGVTFVAGSAFGDGCESYARLAFSSPPLELIETGVRRLAEACTSVRESAPSSLR